MIRLLLAMWLVLFGALAAAHAEEEFRAYWVDFGNPGMKTSGQIADLVSDTKAAHMNAILAQVRPRGDAFYLSGYEPRSEYLTAASPTDPLRELLDLAHAQNPRIEVHAWFNAYKMWSKATPPASPYHPYHLFPEFWNRDATGNAQTAEGWFFDPGHNRQLDYNVHVLEDLARRYPDLDGIHFDFVRYPTYNWGLSDTALARFSAHTGVAPARTDGVWTTPKSNTLAGIDPTFSQWRRDQVTGFVREAYARVYRVNPNIKMSAALITIGSAPAALSQAAWYAVDPPRYRYQDWYAWMREGLLDEAIAMNYEAHGGSSFQGWASFVAGADDGHNTYGIVGQGNYLNSVPNSILQLRNARALGSRGHATYSYAAPSIGKERARWAAALTVNNADNAQNAPWPTDVEPLSAPWKRSNGLLMGRVTDRLTDAPPLPATNAAGPVPTPRLAGLAVRIAAGPAGQAGRVVPVNASGAYAFVNAPPGAYAVETVLPDDWPFEGDSGLAVVRAGEASTVDLRLSPLPGAAEIIVDNGSGSTTSDTGSFYTESGAALFRVPAADAYAGAARAMAPGQSRAVWTPFVPVAGRYRVHAWWSAGTNRATDAAYTVEGGGDAVAFAPVNQRENGGTWNLLGTAYFHQGRATRIALDPGTDGYTIADAIRLERDIPEFWPRTSFTVPRSTLTDPAIDGEYAYFGQRDGTIFAYHLAEERPAWSLRPADLPAGARHGRPAVHDGRLYIGGVDGRVRAFQTVAGVPSQARHLWSSEAIPGGVFGAPSALGDEVYVGGGDGRVIVLNASDGALRASSPSLGAPIRSTPAVLPGSGVWVELMNGRVARLSLGDLTVRWASEGGAGTNSSVYTDGRGVYAAGGGALLALNAANGNPLWSPPPGMAAPAAAPMGDGAGTLYVVTADSRLWALDTETGAPHAGFTNGMELPEDTYGPPLVARSPSGTARIYLPGSSSLLEASAAGMRRHDLARAMGTHGAGQVHTPATSGSLIVATADNGQLLVWPAPAD